MRMWMVNPRLMCRRHLLGEHVETHMLLGSLAKGRSIAGHVARGQLEPRNAIKRHDRLARELSRRGYDHKSPARADVALPINGSVDRSKSLADLTKRCAECRATFTRATQGA